MNTAKTAPNPATVTKPPLCAINPALAPELDSTVAPVAVAEAFVFAVPEAAAAPAAVEELFPAFVVVEAVELPPFPVAEEASALVAEALSVAEAFSVAEALEADIPVPLAIMPAVVWDLEALVVEF